MLFNFVIDLVLIYICLFLYLRMNSLYTDSGRVRHTKRERKTTKKTKSQGPIDEIEQSVQSGDSGERVRSN